MDRKFRFSYTEMGAQWSPVRVGWGGVLPPGTPKGEKFKLYLQERREQPFVVGRASFSGVCAFVLTTPAPPHTLKIDGTSAAASQSSSNKGGEADFKETCEICRILLTLFDLPFPFQSLLPSRPDTKVGARPQPRLYFLFRVPSQQKCSTTHKSP